MANSQNGWPVVGATRIIDKEVLGVDFPNGWLMGDVDVVFTELILDLNRIEKLHDGWCWGYYVKNIEGSSSIGNHASGTAFDYNAPEHPMGARGTWSSTQRNQINALLRDKYNGVVRWGANYTGRADDMHFEINDDAAAVKRTADEIRASKIPPREVTHMKLTVNIPQLKQGDSDDQLGGYNLIVRMQRIIGAVADGDWGPLTTEKIAAWCHIDRSKAKVLTEDIYRKVFGAAE